MATIVGHLQARLSATSAAFAQDMEKAKSSAKGLGAGMKGLGADAFIAGGAFGLAFGAISKVVGVIEQAVTSIPRLVSEQIQVVDSAREVAMRLGITTDQLLAYQFAAKMANVESGQLSAALTKMARGVTQAAISGGKLESPFMALGVSAKELAGMSIDKQFETIAEAISKIESPALRVKLAMDIFGKSGAELMGIFAGGEAGIEDAIKRYHELAGTLSEVDAAKLGAAADAMDELSTAWDGLGRQLAVTVVPALKDVVEYLTKITVMARKGDFVGIVLPGFMETTSPEASFQRMMAKFPKPDAGEGDSGEAEAATARAAEVAAAAAAEVEIAAAESRQKSIDSIIAGLEKEGSTIGMTTAELVKYNLAQLMGTEANTAANQEIIDNAGALAEYVEALREDEAQRKHDAAAIESTIDALQRERDTYGKSAADIAEYELRKHNASQEAIDHARALAGETDAMKAQADAAKETAREQKHAAEEAKRDQEQQQKELESAGKAVTEATRTPFEKFEAEMKRLAELRDKHAIDAETFGRAAEAARKGLDEAIKPDEVQPIGGVAAAEQGSSAAASIIARSLNMPGGEANKPDQRVAKNTDELKKLAVKNNFNLEKLIVNTQPLADLVEVTF